MKKTKLLIAVALTLNFGLFTFTCSAQFTNILDFTGTNGDMPNGSLISDGTYLYGVSKGGGANGYGEIFKMKPDGTGFVDLFDFDLSTNGGSPVGALYSDGTFLYGMNDMSMSSMGNIYKIKTDGTGFAVMYNFIGAPTSGKQPTGSLVSDGTYLYGMSQYGGSLGLGLIFKIKPDGTGFTDIYDFVNNINSGKNPQGSLFYDGTFLYGMAAMGGNSSMGVLFKIMPNGTGYTTLNNNFSGYSNGANPWGSLISDGTFLYGMTQAGGVSNAGTIFKQMPDGSGYTKLYDFAGATDGAGPDGDLTLNGGYLYGMTFAGGTGHDGTLFKIRTDGSGYSNLLNFSGSNGKQPYGSLLSEGSCLYGMTSSGGANSLGNVFKYCLATGIAENITDADFTISPNPSSGTFNLKMNVSDNLKMKNIEIYNVVGEKVYQSQINNQQTEIDLSSQPAGIYFLHLQTEEGTSVKKIIISQ